MLIFNSIETVLFVVLTINVFYLLVFSVASHFPKRKQPAGSPVAAKRIALLIPAYKEDQVIRECVDSCLAQHYPKASFDVVVISDRMSDETNTQLSQLPVRLIRVYFENSTKSKALNYAMEQLGDGYDIAVILDADNTISPDFLSRINTAFSSKDEVLIVQAHRCAKNTNNPLALLDAVSEEINNSIFRLGHVNLGFSAALIGSGMAFDYTLFKNTMRSIDAIGGFDRALELKFLREGVRIHYLSDVHVLDEKVQRRGDFSRQRRRWLSAQFHYLSKTYKQVGGAIKEGRWDFCDKLYQQTSVPRVMLLGFCFLIPLVLSFFVPMLAIKWWILFFLLLTAMLMAIPRTLYRKELGHAVLVLPFFFLVMVFNLFRLKGANKRFIHTQHGVNS